MSKGFCYRLVTRTFWDNEIPEYTIPEMLVRTTLSGHGSCCTKYCHPSMWIRPHSWADMILSPVSFSFEWFVLSTVYVCVCVYTAFSFSQYPVKGEVVGYGRSTLSTLHGTHTPKPGRHWEDHPAAQRGQGLSHLHLTYTLSSLSQTQQGSGQCVLRKCVLPTMHCIGINPVKWLLSGSLCKWYNHNLCVMKPTSVKRSSHLEHGVHTAVSSGQF